MKRLLLALAVTGLVIIFGLARERARAQETVAYVPVVSPTYIAVPPPRQEVIPVAPAPTYVWVGGHWDRTPDSWNWVGGSWVQPPFSNAYWVPGYWQHQGGQYVWEDAHWAAAAQGVVAAKPVEVPPLYAETVPAVAAAPANQVWQPGHWEWRGTWVWVPGVYVDVVAAQAQWVPGQWVVGADGQWRWMSAHWAAA